MALHACRPAALCLWVELDAPVSTALARAAAELDLRIAPGPAVRRRRHVRAFLRLPYVLPVPQVREAVARLAEARHRVERPAARMVAEPARSRLLAPWPARSWT